MIRLDFGIFNIRVIACVNSLGLARRIFVHRRTTMDTDKGSFCAAQGQRDRVPVHARTRRGKWRGTQWAAEL